MSAREDLSIIEVASLDCQLDQGKKRVSINRLPEHPGLIQIGDLLLRLAELPGNEQNGYLPFLSDNLQQFDAVQSSHSIVGNDQRIGAGLQSD
jgi:hypothetical protein